MEEISLKSNLLIKLFGKSEITFEELREIEDLLLDGEEIAFSDEEVSNIQSDLVYVFKEIKENMRDISIVNCPDSLRDYIIKNAPTENIFFVGYEEFYNALKEREVDVSDEFLKYFGDKEKTEYELFKYTKALQYIELKTVITMQDYEIIQKYANISDFEIKIETFQEYEKFLSVVGNENVNIITNKDALYQIYSEGKELPSNISVNLELKDVSELSGEEIELISQTINIKSIHIPAEKAEKQNKDCYTTEEYLSISKKIENILNSIDNSKPEMDRFMKIYQTLANMIEYEFDDDGKPASRVEAHNLKGGLLEGKCVCEGYAKILQQVLKCSGIDCKYVVGVAGLDFESNDRHAWNQVKIDGVWYNCDLTWDAGRIRENRPLDDCLKSDRDFILHDAESKEKMECNQTYNRNKINQYLGYTTALEFEEKEYAANDLINLLQDIKQYSANGVRASIQEDIATGNYYMLIGNIVNENEVRWSDNEILFENMEEFFKQYIETFPTESIDTIFIKSCFGIELVVSDNLMKQLSKRGIAVDKLLTEQQEIKQQQETGIILNSVNGRNVQDIQETTLRLNSVNEKNISELIATYQNVGIKQSDLNSAYSVLDRTKKEREQQKVHKNTKDKFESR